MKTKLLYSLMYADTNSDVNAIVNENIEYLNDNPGLFTYVKNARKRISRIRKEMKNSWKVFELN